jgi:hypothetical protein
MDRLWQLTQTPEFHQLWDLRFSEIQYLPRADSTEPQQFLYRTRIGFGVAINGRGETAGSHGSLGGQRSSALKFWSDDPRSLIRKGSGYWKYIPLQCEGLVKPDDSCVRFVTGYDYDVRFGAFGRIVDRTIFRPLIGWATAWSFDRLRLWIETGAEPAGVMRRSLIYAIARSALGLVWLYQGVMPKLLVWRGDEWALLRAAGLSDFAASVIKTSAGCGEIILALILLLFWRSRWPLWFTVASMPVALLAAAFASPRILVGAFNPATLNVSVLALALIAILSAGGLPSASRCVRQPPREQS